MIWISSNLINVCLGAFCDQLQKTSWQNVTEEQHNKRTTTIKQKKEAVGSNKPNEIAFKGGRHIRRMLQIEISSRDVCKLPYQPTREIGCRPALNWLSQSQIGHRNNNIPSI